MYHTLDNRLLNMPIGLSTGCGIAYRYICTAHWQIANKNKNHASFTFTDTAVVTCVTRSHMVLVSVLLLYSIPWMDVLTDFAFAPIPQSCQQEDDKALKGHQGHAYTTDGEATTTDGCAVSPSMGLSPAQPAHEVRTHQYCVINTCRSAVSGTLVCRVFFCRRFRNCMPHTIPGTKRCY